MGHHHHDHVRPTGSTGSEAPRRLIGKLCFGGDWACANGDLEALGDVAVQLAGYAHEPLHCELVALSELCHSDPERASAAWVRLKSEVLRGVAPS